MAGAGDFSLLHSVQTVQPVSGAHPASSPVRTAWASTEVKRLRRTTDHELPSSAKVQEYVEIYIHFPLNLHGFFFFFFC
jgi:hypothetical protein